MLDILLDGGIILWIILFLAFVATVIIIERLLYFRRNRLDENTMMSRLQSTLAKGHFDEAISICESNPAPITNLMKIGIENRKRDERTIKEMVMSAANMEIPKMERFLTTLGSIATIAPLLGLLGTVTGNIQTFGILSEAGVSGDPAGVASGIAEALLTTAAGIIVSIPAITFYNYLVSRVNHTIIRLENRVNDMVVYLVGRTI
jgi:biopolymer transport protein ExbB